MDIRRELQQNKFQLDKPFEHLFTKWQRNMFRLNKSLIWIATVIEIITAIGGISERVYSFGVLGYFLRCVFVPFLINVGVYCLGIWMYQHPTISDEHKVAVPILTMIIMFTSLVTIHYVFPMLLGVFIIPVFISTIYANRNVVLRTLRRCDSLLPRFAETV